ncbi:M4 family metallopeptidase [Micromonospora sp. WMMD882]|uniref:M4 family metallopeptidase n=1 Tax=Micromonospora sp. WMMD882 TaxID=3015151 RepID=UPI00248CBCC9|nr:M4 family metallopeptidase [Micromonospora sp. WMMD882]WBB78924.1 M4 family metallopeptidase [Micromonospora sp. WMMD882]
MRRSLAAVSSALLASSLLTGVAATPAQAAPTPADPDAAARSALRANPAVVKGSNRESYAAHRTTVDRDGAGHVRYTRRYQGLRVAGGDFVIHTTPGGGYAGSSVGLTTPLTLDVKPTFPAASAKTLAAARFKGRRTSVGTPELFVDATSGKGRLAWETVITGWQPDGQTPSRLHVVVDATTGRLIGTYDEIAMVAGTGYGVHGGQVTIDTVAANGSYTLTDPVRGDGSTCDMGNDTVTCAPFTDADNVWGSGTVGSRQSAAVDAHYGAAKTYDYFKNVHGRDGVFGDGRGVRSRVHYGDNYDNAFWDGLQMTYGDGWGNASPLVSLDIAGHEMTHGVTDNVVPGGLTYAGEAGGLNEATSDIFGTAVEFYANNPTDPGDYRIGEKLGPALRVMYNPAQDGVSDSCWSTATAGKDVHFSSGVGNHFFFNLAEGTGATPYGTSPVCGSAPAVTGIGRTRAERIWWRALDVYFTSNTSYVNTANPGNTARAYTLRAAADLFGGCGVEYRAVQAAWTAVNVAGGDAACTAADGFSLTLTPTSTAVNAGESATAGLTLATTGGAAQPEVTFSVSGLPAGATASFSPTVTSSDGQTTLTVTTAAGTPAGSYPVTVTATGATVTRTASLTLIVYGPGGVCPVGQQLVDPGFESGGTGWTATPGVVGQFGAVGQPARTGVWSAWLGGHGRTSTDSLDQRLALPAGCATYTLSYWMSVRTAETSTTKAYDTIRVQVLDGSGAVLATLATYSNLSRSDGYVSRSLSLAPYQGQSVTLRFVATEDVSLQTSFVLDDLAVTIA